MVTAAHGHSQTQRSRWDEDICRYHTTPHHPPPPQEIGRYSPQHLLLLNASRISRGPLGHMSISHRARASSATIRPYWADLKGCEYEREKKRKRVHLRSGAFKT
ncbi:hypothetical protein EVAR_93461_1 [Eumeta japonica]|uniref:Uncharacterized protein n=1 Tax=Eumeta variegata TaxID=151549 RepID=A0A4C1TMH0_EUMVA|nr:hypothetical protein EVAR_93461_1 [Eumeta japonica]